MDRRGLNVRCGSALRIESVIGGQCQANRGITSTPSTYLFSPSFRYLPFRSIFSTLKHLLFCTFVFIASSDPSLLSSCSRVHYARRILVFETVVVFLRNSASRIDGLKISLDRYATSRDGPAQQLYTRSLLHRCPCPISPGHVFEMKKRRFHDL